MFSSLKDVTLEVHGNFIKPTLEKVFPFEPLISQSVTQGKKLIFFCPSSEAAPNSSAISAHTAQLLCPRAALLPMLRAPGRTKCQPSPGRGMGVLVYLALRRLLALSSQCSDTVSSS